MNELSKETLLVIVNTLSEKVRVQELVEQGYAKVVQDLNTHIDMHHTDMEEDMRLITILREESAQLRMECDNLREANANQRRTISDLSYRGEENHRLQNQNNELWERVRQLQSENYKLRFGGSTPEETANNYMRAEGEKVWEKGNKIECIKQVRACTGWGLKETKDWCEAYSTHKVVFTPPQEESGPGTKRSSQIPAGVGVQSKRSA